MNDINIQVEQYYNARKDKGWHIDAGHERLAKYLFDSSYGFCKVGIYTEPNTPDMAAVLTLKYQVTKVLNPLALEN